MCKVLEEMYDEALEKGEKIGIEKGEKITMYKMVQSMLSDGTLTLEKIAEITHLPLEEVKRLQREHNV